MSDLPTIAVHPHDAPELARVAAAANVDLDGIVVVEDDTVPAACAIVTVPPFAPTRARPIRGLFPTAWAGR